MMLGIANDMKDAARGFFELLVLRRGHGFLTILHGLLGSTDTIFGVFGPNRTQYVVGHVVRKDYYRVRRKIFSSLNQQLSCVPFS